MARRNAGSSSLSDDVSLEDEEDEGRALLALQILPAVSLLFWFFEVLCVGLISLPIPDADFDPCRRWTLVFDSPFRLSAVSAADELS